MDNPQIEELLTKLLIIDEAEDFAIISIISCCPYAYYHEGLIPPWDFDQQEE